MRFRKNISFQINDLFLSVSFWIKFITIKSVAQENKASKSSSIAVALIVKENVQWGVMVIFISN